MRIGFKVLSLTLLCIGSMVGLLTAKTAQTDSSAMITGRLIVDDSWESKVYLSHIPAFDQRYEISNQMIIAETSLDSLGNFMLSVDFLPTEYELYRLHLVKKGESRASLIIGGQNENHLFLVLKQNSRIKLQNNPQEAPFDVISFSGSPENQSFYSLLQLYEDSELQASVSNASARQMIRDQLLSDLLKIADTSSFVMTSMYAAYLHQYRSGWERERYAEILNNWRDNTNPYAQDWIEHQEEGFHWVYPVAFVVLLVIAALIGWFQMNRASKRSLLNDLSVQERRIFSLLRKGKTNQEISDECNIAVSTVKTHVSNIYSKLDISSRKEVMNLPVD
jgi:DNA-binding CsgD family transcriptional regulator